MSDKSVAEILDEAFDRLTEAGPPPRPETPVHIAPPDQVVDFLVPGGAVPDDYGRGPAMMIFNVADRKAKTAKNKRRSRARWRRRELRRSAGSTEQVAAATPTLAPSVLADLEGKPGWAGFNRGVLFRERPDAGEPGLMRKNWRYVVTVANILVDDPDGPLVPLPERPKPEERSFVGNKWGEHD